MQVARDGEAAEPRVPAPVSIRPVLGFSRLSAAAYASIRRAVDDDDAFRARVAATADEEAVGRAGWLWLHRPDGWNADSALAAAPVPGPDDDRVTRLRREREGAEATAARHRRRADETEAARRRVEAELNTLRRTLAGRDADLRRSQEELDRLTEERNGAVRAQKALEADLAAARRDLRVARAATRQAEADLLARPDPPMPVVVDPSSVTAADDRAVHHAVSAAADAAAGLARALGDAAAALAPGREAAPAAPLEGDASVPTDPTRAAGTRRPRPAARRATAVPLGMIAGTPEADRHLVRSSGVVVVVDGYNLARTAWSGLTPEEERRRTIALLEEVGARSGARIEVVFDGDDHARGPTASRAIGVRFSATGVTADDAIAQRLARLPATSAVVVVSTDRAVTDDARDRGADVLTSAAFLAAVGR